MAVISTLLFTVVRDVYLTWYVYASHLLLADYLATVGSETTTTIACHGETLTFECRVNGGVSTVWKGDAFNCSNEIVLLHSRYNSTTGTNGTCGNGSIIAHAESLYTNSNNYFSQINVTATFAFTGTTFTIVCVRDSGIHETIVSSWFVSIRNSIDSLICGGNISLDDQQQDTTGINYRIH